MFDKGCYTVLRNAKNVNGNGNGFVGYRDLASRQYVIGFSDARHAREACASLHPAPKVILHRSDAIHNLDGTKDITVDYAATLYLPKKAQNKNKKDMEEHYQLRYIRAGDFIMYPLDRSIGVILPLELLEENSMDLVYAAQVIDPCYLADSVLISSASVISSNPGSSSARSIL